jgi:hypothetical protein
MASKLDVDEIAAKNGTDPVTLTKQSASKVWVNFNGTGTIAIRDSLNVSGLTDHASGDTTVTFSNALDNTSYAPNGMQQIGITSSDDSLTSVMIRTSTNGAGTATTMTTTANRILTKYVSPTNVGENDSAVVSYTVDGDLA